MSTPDRPLQPVSPTPGPLAAPAPDPLLAALASAAALAAIPVVMFLLFGDSLRPHLGSSGRLILEGELWRLGTDWLTHGSLSHLTASVAFLLVFGTWTSLLLGARAMITLFLLGDVIAAAVSSFLQPDVLAIGASAGCYVLVSTSAIAAGLAWHWAPHRPRSMELAGSVIGGGFALYSLASMILVDAPARVDVVAHLAGLGAGAFLMLLWCLAPVRPQTASAPPRP